MDQRLDGSTRDTAPARAPAGNSSGVEARREAELEPIPSALPRRRRWPWLFLAFAVVAVAAAYAVLNDGGTTAESPTEALAPDFASVTVSDLIEEESFNGTLGTEAADPVRTLSGGTVTRIPSAGSILSEGDVLFDIDGEPVVLMTGSVPAFRDLGTPEEATTTSLGNGLAGTVTRVAESGVFESGDILYWVDEQPVVLLEGDLPPYRSIAVPPRGDRPEGPDVMQLKEALIDLGYDPDGTVDLTEVYGGNAEAMVERWQEDIGAEADGTVEFGDVVYARGPVEIVEFLIAPGDAISPGVHIAEVPDLDEELEVLEGDDVLQLEAALSRLGFDADGAMTVDGVWDAETEAAVVAWQRAIGADDDGIVDLGEVVFLPDRIRVLSELAPLGTAIGGGASVLEVSSADKLVAMDLPAEDQGLLSVGDDVVVELPSGVQTPATVIEVASVATVSGNNSTVFEVTLALDDPAVAEGLDEAPVDVLVVTDSALGVMTVPVTSLLVLAEGGYAVEVDAGDGTTRLVGVEIGFFADGLVEVRSSVLEPGHQVVVP